jgi:AraC-like DNA-binding protein
MGYKAGALEVGRGRSVPSGGPLEMVTPKRSSDWRVLRILHFVDTHNGRLGWDLDELCVRLELGITGSHAAKLFTKHTGIGIREYAKERRLELAAQQLRSTTDSIKQIALELGYTTPNDLRRQFKKRFRLNPTEFRTIHRRSLHDRFLQFEGGNA